jgi:hypothetical protein
LIIRVGNCTRRCKFSRLRLCENCLIATGYMREDMRFMTLLRARDNY